MNTRSTVVVFFLLGISLFTQAQSTKTMQVKTFPDSAAVYVNDQLMGYTPLFFSYSYNLTEYKTYEIKLVKKGYVTHTRKLTSGKEMFQLNSEMKVPLIRDHLLHDSITIPIEINKVVFEMEEGKRIGTINEGGRDIPLGWSQKYSTSKNLFTSIASEELSKSGFVITNNPDNETPVKSAPALQLNSRLKSIQINYDQEQIYLNSTAVYAPRLKNVKCKVEIEWEVVSLKNQLPILYIVTTGIGFAYEPTDLLPVINRSLHDAATVLGQEAAMRNVVKNALTVIPKTQPANQKTEIPKVKTETFADFSAMIKKRVPLAVTIIRDDNGHGSGFFISDNGYLLTNFHVVERTNSLTIKLDNGTELPAEVVTYDDTNDVALLKVKGSGFKGMPLNTAKAEVGTEVTAIGTPAQLDLGQTITKGIISGKREFNERIFYQVDLSVSKGSSGGPVLNNKGEVLGIVTWGIRETGTEGLNFAIPISVAIEKLGIVFSETPGQQTTPAKK